MSSNVQETGGLSKLANLDSFLTGQYGIWSTSGFLIVLIGLNFVATMVYYLVDFRRCGTSKRWRKIKCHHALMGVIVMMQVTILALVCKRGVKSFNFIFDFTRTSNYMRLVSFIQNLLSSSVLDVLLEIASLMPDSFVKYFDYVDKEVFDLIIEVVFDVFNTTDGLGNGDRNFSTFFVLPDDQMVLDLFTVINKAWKNNPSNNYKLDTVYVDEMLFSYSLLQTINFIINFGIFYLSNLNWTFMIIIAIMLGTLVSLTLLTCGFFTTHVCSDVKYGAYVVSVAVMIAILTLIVIIITSLIDNIERNFGKNFDLVDVLMESLSDLIIKPDYSGAAQPFDYKNSRYLLKLILTVCKNPERFLINKLIGLEKIIEDVSDPIYINLICNTIEGVLQRNGLWDDLDSERNEMIYRKSEEFIYHVSDIIYSVYYTSIGLDYHQMFDLRSIVSNYLFV